MELVMTSGTHDDVHTLSQQLAEECGKAGLDAKVVAPTRVRVSLPGAHSRLAETIRCMPDPQERLTWWWSWGEPICLATQIPDAVKVITHVVTPPGAGQRPPLP
jgi:hypothetical protein